MKTSCIALLLVLSLFSCSHKLAPASTVVYDGSFVVSFFSRGSGTNYTAVSKFDQFIKDFNAKNPPAIAYTVVAWGREGEKDYCFQPTGKANFSAFITQTNELLKDQPLIHITEHQACKTK